MPQTAEQRRIEELEEQVAFLQQELGMTKAADALVALRRGFRLSPKEAEILSLLYARRHSSVVSKAHIFDTVWGLENEVEIKIVDVLICKLRKKIGGQDAIETVWGVGYRLASAGAQRVKELLDNVPC